MYPLLIFANSDSDTAFYLPFYANRVFIPSLLCWSDKLNQLDLLWHLCQCYASRLPRFSALEIISPTSMRCGQGVRGMHLVQQFLLRLVQEPLLFPPKPCPRPCAHAVPAAPLGHLAPVQASFKCGMPANERLLEKMEYFFRFSL